MNIIQSFYDAIVNVVSLYNQDPEFRNQVYLTPTQLQEFLGSYVQLVRTPNNFQTTPYATATYFDDRSAIQDNSIRLINREFQLLEGKLYMIDSINGKLNTENYLVSFENILIPGYYRIMEFDTKSKYGVYVVVSSITPSTSWILWKPSEEVKQNKSLINEAYNYGLSKIKFLESIGVDKKTLIIADRKYINQLI
jgi:lipocalin